MISSQDSSLYIQKLFFQIKAQGLGCSLVGECLPSMCEALGLIPAPKKGKK
jgi:hypothetical protein